MSAGSEFTGSLDAVEQERGIGDDRIPRVPVVIDDVVPVQVVGSRAGASVSKSLLAANGSVLLLGADQRRRIARVIATAGSVYIGTTQSAVDHLVAALWPANVPCEITHQEDIYVKVTADAVVSVMVENWAD